MIRQIQHNGDDYVSRTDLLIEIGFRIMELNIRLINDTKNPIWAAKIEELRRIRKELEEL